MQDHTEAHFEQAGRHLQAALRPVLDTVCQTYGFAGLLVIAFNSAKLADSGVHSPAHSREVMNAMLLGLGLLSVAAGRFGIRWWTHRKTI